MGKKMIPWEELASKLGLLRVDGEVSGDGYARHALELILGEDVLRASVDHYVARRRGSELARSVLCLLHPWGAMRRCYEIFRGSESLDSRRMAVELLRVVADRRAVPWIPEFLADEDPDIQAGGVGVLDQLLFSDLIWPEEAEDLLKAAERHVNPYVREQAELIRGYLKRRESAVRSDEPPEDDQAASPQE